MAVFILLEVSACSKPSTRLSTRRRDSPATSRRWQDTKHDSTLGRGLLPGLFVCANAGTTNATGLTPLRRPCSDASVGHRICVIAKGLGCLHWLAHSAEDGPILGRLHNSARLSLCSSSLSKTPCWKIGCNGTKDTVVCRESASLMVSRAAGRPLEGTKSESLLWSNESLPI